jgi:hypothetical protein
MGNKKTFLAGKSASKQASGAGATLSIDNDVKIVQCFQGLTLIAQTVIVWDSELAQKFVHPGVVVYIAPDESRFEIRVQAIVPTKCNLVTLPLPRIVTHDESTKTGFGKSINAANSLFQDGRQGPNVFVFRGTSQAELNKMGNRAATRPLTDEA